MFSVGLFLLFAVNPVAFVATGTLAAPQTPSSNATKNWGNAEISQTQQAAYQAVIEEITSSGLRLTVGNETRVVPFDQLLRARIMPVDPSTSPQPNRAEILVELNDGSRVYCDQITSDGKMVTLQWKDSTKVELSPKVIASCMLRPIKPELDGQWKTMVESQLSSDLLVLARSEEALDKIEGIIGTIDEKTVTFSLDGQTIPVAKTKLAGFRFFSAATVERAKLLAVVKDARGNEWMAHRMETTAANAKVHLKLAGGVELDLDSRLVTEIDFSFGSMRFLADLEPLERKTTPRFQLQINIPESEKLFGPQPAAAQSQKGATVGPGIDFVGSGSITYRIPNDFKRLMGTALLATDGPKYVPCKVQILLEDKLLFEQEFTTPLKTVPIDVPVEAGKRLKLIVTANGDASIGDFVSLRQLRFVK